MQQFDRLDAGDLDLILKTLKEFAGREASLDKRLKWDEDGRLPRGRRAGDAQPGGRPAPGVPARRVRRHGRRRVRRVPVVHRVREDRPRPGDRHAGRGARHRPDPRRLHPRAEGEVGHPNRQRRADRRLRRDRTRGRVERAEPQDHGRAHHRRRRPRHALQAERRQAVHLERVDRRPLHHPRQGARRPHLLRGGAQDTWTHAGQARDQARHPPVRHGAGAPPGRRHPRREHRRREGRARGSSRRTRCSATRG